MDPLGMLNPLKLDLSVHPLLTSQEYMGAPIPISANQRHSMITKGDLQRMTSSGVLLSPFSTIDGFAPASVSR